MTASGQETTAISLSDRLPGDPGNRYARFAEQRPTAGLLLDASLVLLTYLLLHAALGRVTRLPTEAWFDPWLGAALFTHGRPALLLAGLALLALLIALGTLHRPWQAFDSPRLLRGFVVFIAAVVAWPLALYGYNHYFDQPHLFDRLALLALLPLTWWRPAFALVFLLVAYPLLWQFGAPALGGSIFPHKQQLLTVLELFAAFLVVRSIAGGRRSDAFVLLTGCSVAASYWLPALGKWQIDWLQQVNLHLALPAAHAHGWLSSLGEATVGRIAAGAQAFDLPIAILVIGFETLCLAFFFRRGLSLTLLSVAILFHAGVFAYFGFLFWTWMLLDAALLVLLLRLPAEARQRLYSPPAFVASFVLIAGAAYWADTPKLAWHETRLDYSYRVSTVHTDGTTRTVPPRYFGPYADTFTMMPFGYLARSHAVLVGSYGVTADSTLARAINSTADGDALLALEAGRPADRYDAKRVERLAEFLARYVGNRLASGPRLAWLDSLSAPPQFWGYRGDTLLPADVDEILVEEVTSWFDGRETRTLRRDVVLRTTPASPAARP